ncbi:MAG: hypothetical protein V1720_13995 [bacterium]
MSYILTLSNDSVYLILRVRGDLTAKLALKYNLIAHNLGQEIGINRYLIDLTESRNVDSIINNYYFAYNDMNNPGIDKTAFTAFLVNADDKSHDIVETFAKNAGLNVSLFTNWNDAERFLNPIENVSQKRRISYRTKSAVSA